MWNGVGFLEASTFKGVPYSKKMSKNIVENEIKWIYKKSICVHKDNHTNAI